MIDVLGNRKETFYFCVSFLVLYTALFQVQSAGCAAQEILKRILRSMPRPDYQTIATLVPDQAVYSPKTPFLGDLSENLSDGKIVRIYGYLPEDLKRFDINLCSDCQESSLQFHTSVRFEPEDVVRNSYTKSGWGLEERDSKFPFQLGQEFVLQIEVNSEGYFISVNGQQLWEYDHRLPYTSVDKLEIGGAMLIWKVEYTDKSHEMEKYKYQIDGDVTSGLSIDIKANPASMLEKFAMDLKCECTPQPTTNVEHGASYEERK